MNIFSCRFECSLDYTILVVTAHVAGVCIHTNELHRGSLPNNEDLLPDVDVEFACDATKEEVLEIMRSEGELHVGIQTLRQVPLKYNSLERDYSISF